VKVICGLGNPGTEYAGTRHNVGWWAVEHAQRAWHLPPFRRIGSVRQTEGRTDAERVVLLEPLTYMNRSGSVLAPLLRLEGFDVARDLLVVVDDAALDVGRVRLRASGSAGGHNGLKSVEATLRTRDYARLRIGVGVAPPAADLADWVLSAFDDDSERQILALLPDIADALQVWVEEGVAAAATRINR
jgi:peptidyl-tRNA hydrolase, PTH1 family